MDKPNSVSPEENEPPHPFKYLGSGPTEALHKPEKIRFPDDYAVGKEPSSAEAVASAEGGYPRDVVELVVSSEEGEPYSLTDFRKEYNKHGDDPGWQQDVLADLKVNSTAAANLLRDHQDSWKN